MTLKINWWEIGDKQNLHLDPKELDFIRSIIEKKYEPLYSFGMKLSIGSLLYSILKYKKQGIKVNLLVLNGNLEKKLDRKRIKYVLKSNDLSTLSSVNLMRRKFGWR